MAKMKKDGTPAKGGVAKETEPDAGNRTFLSVTGRGTVQYTALPESRCI